MTARILLITTLFLSPIVTVTADSEAEQPLTIVITGSNIPVDESSANARQQVISRKEIQQLNPQSVPQLLNAIPGLYVENSVSRGGLSNVYLRGAEANYTLVLIDGMKVNDPSNNRGGGFDFSNLDIHSIERVEIYKGAGSFIYGSTAIAGVINIITRQADAGHNLAVVQGSRGYADGSVTYTAGNAHTSMALSVNYADEGEQMQGSSFIGRSMTSTIAWRPGVGQKVETRMHYMENDARFFPDASGGAQYYDSGEQENRYVRQNGVSTQVTRQLANEHDLKFHVGFAETADKVLSPKISDGDPVMETVFVPENSSNSSYQRQFAQVLLASSWSSAFKSVLGLEREWETGENQGDIDFGGFNVATLFGLSRNSSALFMEIQSELTPVLSVSAGLRFDKPEHFDSESSPQLGFHYQMGSTSLNLDWSTGFKLPSFYALGHPLVGNPNFEPETSESVEFSVQYSGFRQTRISTALFHSTYEDLIDFDDSGVLVARPKVTISGIELDVMHYFNEKIQVSFNLSRHFVDVENDEDKLNKRPERKAQAMFQHRLSNEWDYTVLLRYVGEITDFAFVTGNKTLDDYWLLNLTASKQLNNVWQLRFSAENVLNEKYEESVGNRSPGLSGRINVSTSW